MTSWRYLDYLTLGGGCPIQEWMRQDDEVLAALRTILYERRELDDWQRPPTRHMKKQFKVLTDEHIGLAELRDFRLPPFSLGQAGPSGSQVGFGLSDTNLSYSPVVRRVWAAKLKIHPMRLISHSASRSVLKQV